MRNTCNDEGYHYWYKCLYDQRQAHYVSVLNFLPQHKGKLLQDAVRDITNIRGIRYEGLVTSDFTIHSKQCLFFQTADTKDQKTEAGTGLSKWPVDTVLSVDRLNSCMRSPWGIPCE